MTRIPLREALKGSAGAVARLVVLAWRADSAGVARLAVTAGLGAVAAVAVIALVAMVIVDAWTGSSTTHLAATAASAGVAFAAQQALAAVRSTFAHQLAHSTAWWAADRSVALAPAAGREDKAWDEATARLLERRDIHDGILAASESFAVRSTAAAVAVALLVVTPLPATLAIGGLIVASWLAMRAHVREPRQASIATYEPRLKHLFDLVVEPASHKELRALGLQQWLEGEWRPARVAKVRAPAAEPLVITFTFVVALGWTTLEATRGQLSAVGYVTAIQAYLLLAANGRLERAEQVLLDTASPIPPAWSRGRAAIAPAGRPGSHRPVRPAAIEVSALTYRYGDTVALDGVSLRIAAGECAAVVGPNGAGKTTLARIIAGSLSPRTGSVRIGDAMVGRGNAASPDVVAMYQDIPRYPLSLAANITAGFEYDRDVLDSVLVDVGMRDFVALLPNGIATELKSTVTGGTDLSAGRWQRIGLARALYRLRVSRAGVLILDEPLATMDALAEQRFNEELLSFAGGSTVLLISHRMATVRRADRVVLLEHGRISAVGSHQDLYERSARYRQLYRAQAALYEEVEI